MYPLADERLSVASIADHWSASIPEHPPPDRLIMTLVAAFWRGQLPIYRADAPAPTDRDELLESFYAAGDDETIAFVSSPVDVPESVAYLDDGTIEVDLTTYIVLPPDRSLWTPAVRQAAFDNLAQTFELLAKHPAGPLPESCLLGISPYQVIKRDFANLCDLNDWPRPGFWFRTRAPRQTTRTSARDKLALPPWFAEQVRLHQGSGLIPTKEKLFLLAKESFKSLTKTAFDEVWTAAAPPSWRRRGRRVVSSQNQVIDAKRQ